MCHLQVQLSRLQACSEASFINCRTWIFKYMLSFFYSSSAHKMAQPSPHDIKLWLLQGGENGEGVASRRYHIPALWVFSLDQWNCTRVRDIIIIFAPSIGPKIIPNVQKKVSKRKSHKNLIVYFAKRRWRRKVVEKWEDIASLAINICPSVIDKKKGR